MGLTPMLMHAQDWIQLARYGHLPVGNLGGDWLLDIADAHFARCLRDCGHLLWITDPSIPDVASRGDDDAMEDLLLSADPAPLEVRLFICLQHLDRKFAAMDQGLGYTWGTCCSLQTLSL